MGFSAEQLARWVAERTDVNVGRLFYCLLLLRYSLWKRYIIDVLFCNTILYHQEWGGDISTTLKSQNSKRYIFIDGNLTVYGLGMVISTIKVH